MLLILSEPTTDDPFVGSVAHELRAGAQREQESAAGRTEVKAPGVGRSGLVASQLRRGREEHVGRDRGHNHQITSFRGNAALGAKAIDDLCHHVGGGLGWGPSGCAVPDAGPRSDPFVVGVDHLFEVGIGEHLSAGSQPCTAVTAADWRELISRVCPDSPMESVTPKLVRSVPLHVEASWCTSHGIGCGKTRFGQGRAGFQRLEGSRSGIRLQLPPSSITTRPL